MWKCFQLTQMGRHREMHYLITSTWTAWDLEWDAAAFRYGMGVALNGTLVQVWNGGGLEWDLGGIWVKLVKVINEGGGA